MCGEQRFGSSWVTLLSALLGLRVEPFNVRAHEVDSSNRAVSERPVDAQVPDRFSATERSQEGPRRKFDQGRLVIKFVSAAMLSPLG